MVHHFTREELYELVWSEPMKKLSTRFGISDVWLAKACRRADIPVPERGYWARVQAGKLVIKGTLAPRGLGMSNNVGIGADAYESHAELRARLLAEPIGPPPSFSENLEHVTERVRRLVRKVPASQTFAKLHPQVARLLDEDERRRERQRSSSFPLTADTPLFEVPIARRRLRIINTLFLALQRCGAKPWIRDRERRETGVEVGQQNVAFAIEQLAIRGERRTVGPGVKQKRACERLRLTIGSRESGIEGQSWEDTADAKLEKHLAEIVVRLLVAGEANYRAGAQAGYEWGLQLRKQFEEELRREREEAERRERERRAMLEKERVEYLLKEAENWRRAKDLRAFVEAVRAASQPCDPTAAERLDRWSVSVETLADEIDPIRAGRIPNEHFANGCRHPR